MKKQITTYSNFLYVSKHIKKIEKWRKNIESKEQEAAKIMSSNLLEELKKTISDKAVNVLKLRVSNCDEYKFSDQQHFSLLEYLCIVALLQYCNSQDNKPKSHNMEIIVPRINGYNSKNPTYYDERLGIEELNDHKVFNLKIRLILTSSEKNFFKICISGCYLFNQKLF